MSATAHNKSRDGQFSAVAVAASMGGIKALSELFSALPFDFPIPLLAVQHGGGQECAWIRPDVPSCPSPWPEQATPYRRAV